MALDLSGSECSPVPIFCSSSIVFTSERKRQEINPIYVKGHDHLV